MRLNGWYIEGYGVFRDYEVRDLHEGLTVFLGPNEAGKSTLLNFVSGVLFGFPQRRGQGVLYPPLVGGRHGGRLFLEGPEGEVVVAREAGERRSLHVTLPGGEQGTEDDLRRLVGFVDSTLFRTVFAFDLTDLHALEKLQAEGIRDRIFSAGIAGAGASARQVVAALKERQAALLRPRAKSVITELLDAVGETREKIVAARAAAAGYPALRAQEEAVAAELARLAETREEAVHVMRNAQELIDLWPLRREREEASAALANLAPIERFPEDGAAHLAAALTDVRSAAERREKLRIELAAKETRKRELEGRCARGLLPLNDRIAACARGLDVYVDRRARLPESMTALGNAEDALVSKLRMLGEGWDETRVVRLDVSISAQEKVRAHEAAIKDGEERVAAARNTLDMKTSEHRKAVAERERLGAPGAEGLPPDAAVLDARERALRSIRANLAEAHAQEAKAEAQEGILKECERALEAVRGAAVQVPPAWWVATILGFAVVVGAASAWFYSNGRAFEAAFLGLFTIGLAVAAYVFRRYRRALLTGEERRGVQELRCAGEREEAARVSAAYAARIHALREEIATAGGVLALAGEATFAALEDCDAALVRDRAARLRFEENQARMREIESREKELLEEVKSFAAAFEGATVAQKAAVAAWAQSKQEVRLPAALSPRGALDFFRDAHAACELVRARDEALERRDTLVTEINAWEESARAVLKAALAEAPGEIPSERLVEEIQGLVRRVRDEEALLAQLAALGDALAELAERIQVEERLYARAIEERDALFAEAGAADESEFRARMAQFSARHELEERVADRDRQLADRLGAGERADRMREILATGDVDRWRTAAADAGEKIAALESERDAALGRARDAARVRRELEASADAATLEVQAAAYTTELDAAVRTWRIVTFAKELIERTLGEFTRNRQPAVLADASRMFALVTDGAYERIVQTDEGASIKVIDRRGAAKSPETLSRGTAEQLYLCLRLGLIAEFSRRHVALPLIMDDVLVNFDSERARAVAAVLDDFANDHQVLLFTCHPETVALVQDTSPGTRVFHMERFGAWRDGTPAAAPEGDEEEEAASEDGR